MYTLCTFPIISPFFISRKANFSISALLLFENLRFSGQAALVSECLPLHECFSAKHTTSSQHQSLSLQHCQSAPSVHHHRLKMGGTCRAVVTVCICQMVEWWNGRKMERVQEDDRHMTRNRIEQSPNGQVKSLTQQTDHTFSLILTSHACLMNTSEQPNTRGSLACCAAHSPCTGASTCVWGRYWSKHC